MTNEEKEVSNSVNEFESLDTDESIPTGESDIPVGEEQDDVLATGAAGTEYDFTKAPKGTKAPPRENMDGQETTIVDAKIILPPMDKPWEPTRDGSKQFKYCTFKLFYENGQQEFYSGVRTFKQVENGGEKYSHPTIMKDGKNQASQLLQKYAKFKDKDPNEVSLHEFLSYLKSKPKAKLTSVEVKNPQTGDTINKNMVDVFL